MAEQKKSLFTRILEGKERSEDYARSTLPTNRWQLFWDIFKGNFGKLVKVNLLTILFMLPLFGVLIYGGMLKDMQLTVNPIGFEGFLSYPYYPEQAGMSELLTFYSNLTLYLGIFITSFIAAVGLSGGMYVVRNMVWTEGVFVTNDFWRGIKLNYKNALQAVLFFCVFLVLGGTLISLSEVSLVSATGSTRTWLKISQATCYVFIVVAALISFWMIALGVNYKLSFLQMLRNAFLMTVGALPQTIFFAALALIPYALVVWGSGFFMVIGILVLIFFGIAYSLLVWLDFAQWLFDKYINPKIVGAKVGRGIYGADAKVDAMQGSASAAEYNRARMLYGRSRLMARPIKPIDDGTDVYALPESFTRDDLQKLRESKQAVQDETDAYEQEHKTDEKYVEYNKFFDEKEKALQDDSKKKKRKPPKMLGQ